MNKLLSLVAIASIFFVSCKKENAVTIPIETPQPGGVDYINLHDTAVQYEKPATIIHLDDDNFSDLKFGVQVTVDPVLGHVKRQFKVSSGIHTKLAVNAAEEVPVMNKNAVIPLDSFNGYDWWLVSSVVMVQRVEDLNGSITWSGHWKDMVRKYLPFQLIKNDGRYNGWVELSVDVQNSQIVLHQLVISKVAEKEIITR